MRAGQHCLSLSLSASTGVSLSTPHVLQVELEALPFAALGQRLQDLVAAYEIDGIGSTEAVWLQPMIWQASFLPLAVLVEAWSRATGLPALFYMDAFHGLLLGLTWPASSAGAATGPLEPRSQGVEKARQLTAWWKRCKKCWSNIQIWQQARRGTSSTFAIQRRTAQQWTN